jgi:hypothetical protein
MRRQAAIEAEFLLAKEMPALAGGEIQKTQIDRFLDFVGKIPARKTWEIWVSRCSTPDTGCG